MTFSPQPRLSIALISAAVLGYELLLMALFSLIQWHHFAYMVVSVGLLGFGASGSFLVLTRTVFENRFRGFAVAQACLFGLGSLVCYALAQQLSFNPEELIWDSNHWLRLALVILLLALPFWPSTGRVLGSMPPSSKPMANAPTTKIKAARMPPVPMMPMMALNSNTRTATTISTRAMLEI